MSDIAHAGATSDVIAIDVGGTNIRAAVVRRDLSVSSIARRPLDKSSPEALLKAMADCAEEVISGKTDVSGIGVAMKGSIDPTTGITRVSGTLKMRNVPVGPFLSERFGVPVYVANDVHAATIGEIVYGAGRQHRDFIYINVGTGIAVGVVIGSQLHRGAGNISGEYGHATVDRNGAPCGCGRRGCLEEVVSGPGIIEQAKRLAEQYPASRLIPLIESGEICATRVFELAEEGDEAANRVVDDTTAYLGDGIVNLVNLLNPEAIILGGGVFSGADGFVNRLERHVRTYAIAEAGASMKEFRISQLDPDKVSILGAAALVHQHETLGRT